MQNSRILTVLMTGLLLLSFSAISFAQDSSRVKEKKQVKKMERKGNMHMNKLKTGKAFQDKNGDGFNDNAADHDGDGIPNGQDPDFDGAKLRTGNGKGGFVDENGDGINDNAEDWDNDGIPNGQDPDFERPQDGSGRQMKHGTQSQNQYGKNSQNQNGRGTGPQDGSGKSGIGPKNDNGSGNCDGTGPKGTKTKGKGKK